MIQKEVNSIGEYARSKQLQNHKREISRHSKANDTAYLEETTQWKTIKNFSNLIIQNRLEIKFMIIQDNWHVFTG